MCTLTVDSSQKCLLARALPALEKLIPPPIGALIAAAPFDVDPLRLDFAADGPVVPMFLLTMVPLPTLVTLLVSDIIPFF